MKNIIFWGFLFSLFSVFSSCNERQLPPNVLESLGVSCTIGKYHTWEEDENGGKTRILSFPSCIENESLFIRETILSETINFYGKSCYWILNKSLTPDGKQICFYRDGTISFLGKWSNGKRDSVWSYYFQNGTKKLSQYYFNGEAIGDYYKYDSLGNLKKYCLQDGEFGCEYIIKFDEQGEIISEKGDPWLVILKRHKPLLSVTDTVIGNIYVSTHNTFHVFAKSEGGMIISLVPFPGRSGLYILKIYFSEIGEVKGRLFIEGKGPQKSYRIFQPLTFTIVDD